MTDTHRRKVRITSGEEDQKPQADQDSEQQAENTSEQATVSLVDELKAALEAEKSRADKEHDSYLRTLAEFQNYKRRQEEQLRQIRQRAASDLILKVLAIVDDFERALASADDSKSFDALHEGLELTLKKLMQVLEGEGVKPIEALGKEFDPVMHEAVMRVEDSEHADNTVVNELQRGYMLESEVIRPSKVAVAVSSS